MITYLHVAQCDICSATAPVKTVLDVRNEETYDVPDGWVRSDANHDFCICPKCLEKLRKESKEVVYR